MDQSFRTSVCKKTLPQVKRRYTLERILSCGVFFHTAKTLFTDTCLIQTPHYGQFVLSLGKECPYILSKFNWLNTDTSFIPTLFMVPSLFALTGCGCTLYFTLYRDGDYTAVLSRFHCTSWPHAMNYPSFLALCYFLIEPIRLTLKHVQFVTHLENQIVNFE